MQTIQQKMRIRGQHIAPVYLNKTIPNLQILCGSRAKPEMAIDVLQLTNVKREDVFRGKNVGRVNIITGDYRSRRFPSAGKVRILVGETQMGQDAVDITQREYVYAAEKEPVVQERGGTSGGLNTRNLAPPVMKLGDIVIVDKNIGRSGAIEQALGYFASVIPNENSGKELAAFLAAAKKYGITPAFGGRFYSNENSPIVTAKLIESAKELGYQFYVGANFTKESLNSESVDQLFLDLREKAGVLVSEMEQLTNAFTAAYARVHYNVNVLTGMIVESIGGVPGPGFPDRNDKKQMALQEKVEGDTLIIAAETLFDFAKGKKK